MGISGLTYRLIHQNSGAPNIVLDGAPNRSPANDALEKPVSEQGAQVDGGLLDSKVVDEGALPENLSEPCWIRVQGHQEIEALQCIQECYANAPSAGECLTAQKRVCRQIYESGQYENAANCAEQCRIHDPENASCRATLMLAYTKLDRKDRLYELIGECLRDEKNESICLTPYQLNEVKRGDITEAETLVSHAESYNKESSWTIYVRALLEERSGNVASSQVLFQKACEMGRKTACQFVDQL